MKRFLLFCFVLLLIGGAAAGGAGYWAWEQLHQPYQGYADSQTVEVRSGQGASSILNELQAAGVLRDARLARAWLIYGLQDAPLLAGEYQFNEPLSAVQVLEKLGRGEVVTYPLTVIEGLTFDETAESIASQGFGSLERLRAEVRRAELIRDLDPKAETLEGYLYPDTYHFARGATEEEIVAKLVKTFRQRWEEVSPLVTDGRSVREVVILASIVEKETQVDEETGLVAGVYANRLRQRIGLYADPTIIYGLKLAGTWDGNLTRANLRAKDNPYNTYVFGGLPPGPICSPAIKSLAAAAAPPDTKYLYFVSRNDGTHVFAESKREHDRNVEVWQRQYWRKRWAEERRRGG